MSLNETRVCMIGSLKLTSSGKPPMAMAAEVNDIRLGLVAFMLVFVVVVSLVLLVVSLFLVRFDFCICIQ